MRGKSRLFTVGAIAAVAAGWLAAGIGTASAAGQRGGGHVPLPPLHVHKASYDRGLSPAIARQAALRYAKSGTSNALPLFTHRVRDGGKTFTYMMVGKNPYRSLANPITTVSTVVVPVIVQLPNGDRFDPTKPNDCAASSALSSTLRSPLFHDKTYRWGGKTVGTGQFTSVFRRAEFFQQTKPGGANPGYEVRLDPVTVDGITVNVPPAKAHEWRARCGRLAGMGVGWWDNYVQNKLMPQLAGLGYTSNTFPIFLLSNVVETYHGCCVLGYHTFFKNPADNGITTYATVMYDSTHGTFKGSRDISAVSHEIAEWMDNPLLSNATKPWGHIGQVTGCQANLEVADPLTGNLQPTKLGARTWHPQELAFASWFYHQKPSTGVNHWYSSNGTFKSYAKRCS